MAGLCSVAGMTGMMKPSIRHAPIPWNVNRDLVVLYEWYLTLYLLVTLLVYFYEHLVGLQLLETFNMSATCIFGCLVDKGCLISGWDHG